MCFVVYFDNVVYCFFFFFSSRRRHTRLQGDWSSDVCSSDLGEPDAIMRANILQGAVERVDSVWDADHERVQADGHHPARLRAFAVENVELPLDHTFELVRTTEAIIDVRGVVDLV